MITNKSFKTTALALLFLTLTANAHGAVTGLSDAPLVTSSNTSVLPNLMFVLDDSGSMGWDFMPDTASNFSSGYGYYSNQCNGVYYEPTIIYKTPVDSTGAPLNAAATIFTAAYTDGYSTGAGTVNLTNSYYYQYSGAQTTAALKKYYDTASTFYRECNSSIGSAPGNAVFTKINLAARTATITVGSSGSTSVSGITVNGAQIMAAATTASTTTGTVATDIATQINACTNALSGACTVSGYVAAASGSVVTIFAPVAASTFTPAITKSGTMTFTATAFPTVTTDATHVTDPVKLQNFANWYSYYRTRILMMKTAAGEAFAPIDNKYRVGFMTINNNVSPDILNFAPFDATQKSAWYTKLYAATPGSSTPLREALANVGRIYAHKLTSLYGATIADPMQYSCQQNFTILSTDGFWNGNNGVRLDGTTAIGQQDGAEPRPYNDGASQLQTTSQLQQSQTQVFKSTSQFQKRTQQIQSSTSNLQRQVSQLQSRASRLQSQTSQLQTQSSTLQGTLSKVLMRCDNTSAACGAAPATGVAGVGSGTASWSVVTSGSCTIAANVQCQIVSGLSGASNVATSCNTAASITTVAATGTATITITNSSSARINQVRFGGTETLDARTSGSSTNSTVASRIANGINNCTGSATGNCTASGNSATVGSGASNNVITITGPSVTSAPTVNVSNGSATVDTSYTAGATTGYTLNNADSNGKIYSACSYTAWSAATGTPSCTAVAQSSASPYTVLTATQCTTAVTSAYANANTCTANATPDGSGYTTQCQYAIPGTTTSGWSSWAGTPSCTAAAQDATNPYDMTATGGVATECQTAITSPYANIGSCTVNATPDGSGNTTQCQYTPFTAYANASSCTALAQSAASPYTVGTAMQCQTTDTGWVGASACTAGVTGGQTVTCQTITTGPTAVASCTAAVAAAGNSYTQTTCSAPTTVPGTSTIGVASCTPGAGAGPDFITTNCNTVTVGPTGAATCTAVAADASNNWTATTCASGSGGIADTLADVAEYYYVNDLRTTALGNCTGAVVPPATVGNTLCMATVPDPFNDVPSTGLDAASHQHMTTFTLGLGARGRMIYSPTYLTDTSGDFFSVKNGSTANGTTVCSWQASGACNWPIPGSNQIENIDDLWHAAVNGRGSYFSATDPASLSTSLSSALAGVSARTGASAAATTSNPNVTSGDNFVFSSTFTTTSWDGELVRQQLDLTTGVTSSTVDWAAQAKLNTKAALTAKAASRTIYTWSAGAADHLQAFNETNFGADANFNMPHISTSPDGLTQLLCASASICAPQTIPAAWQASHAYVATNQFINANVVYQVTTGYTSGATFGATDTTNSSVVSRAGDNLVNFLRGDRTNEGAETDNTKYYRQRANILGDIVNAEAVYVKAPLFNYNDTGYSAFVAAKTSRQGIVYAAANDGMLHAFYAADGGVGIVGGDEAWAYIPSLMLPDLYKLADKEYATHHRYFVDGTPVVGDICPTAPATACTGATWKTILIGGFNKGGRGYYAMDITDPASPKALWEFTDANLGYTYGNPKITKLKDGTWVVLVTSGYNNVPGTPTGSYGGDGVGRLYVIKASDGTLIRSISTGVGSTTTPSGLARIAVRVTDSTKDNTALAAYGGDMLGNLWRFDVNSDIGIAGYDAQLLTTLTGPSPTYTVQPITAKPELGDVSGHKVIYVGTGSYLGAGDLGDTSKQSIYAIKDPLTAGATASTAIYANPRTLTTTFKNQTLTSTTCPAGSPSTICTAGQSVRTSANLAVNFATDNGWFMDLPDSGERANTDPTLSLGTLGFTTNVPNNNACTVGGYSYRYFLDYKTGGAVSTSTTGVVGAKLGNALATRPVYVRLPNGVVVELTRLSTGTTATSQVPIGAGGAATRRTSWRELIEE